MDSDKILNEVQSKGFCIFDLDKKTLSNFQKIDFDSFQDGFHLNTNSHKEFLLGSNELKELIEACKTKISSDKLPWNEINVARVVEGGSSEKLRTHYDSHIYTLVVPALIPSSDEEFRGQLYLLPNTRKSPRFDLINFLQKLGTFFYRGEENLEKLKQNPLFQLVELQVGQAVLFNGNRSMHGNLPNNTSGKRVTFITHMADPFPNGIGALVRKTRKLLGLRK